MCTQACRRLYYQREGEGGYYFSPRDLQLLELLPELADAGVNSFKIEGRMKSADYVGTVVSAYRRLIDGLDGDREGSLREAAAILENDFARRKTRFYMLSSMASGAIEDSPTPDWLDPAQDGGTGIALGTLRQVKGSGEGRQGFLSPGALSPRIGDSVRLHRADDSERKAHKLVAVEKQEGGLWISIPEGFESGDSVYLIQTRSMSKRYPQVIKGDPDMFRRVPGRECAPELELPRIKKADSFPEGVYVAVSCIEDLYVLQSVRPLRVMLPLSRKTLRILLNRRPAVGDPGGTESLSGKQPAEEKGPRLLPFSPGETVLVLDPWFPQSAEKVLKEEIPHLRSLGYHQYVVNNPGHFALFRNGHSQPVNLIAGPYLYAFNRWAAAFVASQGVSAIISPLENNRQNLERTLSPGRRNSAFVTLFSRPALFRIRADLGAVYDFEEFTDSRGEEFRLISSPDGSQVIPERPFNIMDKRPFLEEAGFRRFILDLSGPPLKKKDYRNLMAFYRSASPIPSSCRFNWKDGFYSTETPGGKTVIS
jgi:putative protease